MCLCLMVGLEIVGHGAGCGEEPLYVRCVCLAGCYWLSSEFMHEVLEGCRLSTS